MLLITEPLSIPLSDSILYQSFIKPVDFVGGKKVGQQRRFYYESQNNEHKR